MWLLIIALFGGDFEKVIENENVYIDCIIDNIPIVKNKLINWAVDNQYLDLGDDTNTVTIRKRYYALRYTPRKEDILRFPNAETTSGYMSFNLRIDNILNEKRLIYNENSEKYILYSIAIEENRKLYTFWYKVNSLYTFHCNVAFFRKRLAEIREELGFADYYNANYPTFVPIWILERED